MSEQKKLGSTKASQAAAEIRNLRRWWYDRIENAKKNHEFIAWSMVGVPSELLLAFDVLPVLAENYGPLCAAKQVSGQFCEVAEGEGFSIDLCSYQKVGIGYAIRLKEVGDIPPEAPYGGMGKPDMMIAPTHICDGRYKYLQAASRYADVPYFCYDVQDMPAQIMEKKDEEAKRRYIEHYHEQLKAMVSFLEKMTRKKLDQDRLKETLGYWLTAHRYFHDAFSFRKCHPNPLSSMDSFAICFPNLNFKATKEAADYYQRTYNEMKYRADNKIGAVSDEKYRLFWWGLPPWHNLSIFNYLEDRGIATLDTTYAPGDVPDIDFDDPLYAIARAFYDVYIFANGVFRRRSGGDASNLLKFIQEYDIDGVVTLLGTTCRITTGTLHLKRLVSENATVPVLNLEADMTDTRTWSDAHIKMRLDAFMETVDAAKTKRRQASKI